MLKFKIRDKVKLNITSGDLDPAKNLNGKILIVDNYIPNIGWCVLWIYNDQPYSSIINEDLLTKIA